MLHRKNIFEWKEENRTKITQTGVHALTMFLISVQEWQNKNTQTGVHALTMFLISVQEWQNQNNQTGVHALTMFLISVQEWQNQNNQTGELCFLSLSRNVICCASLFTFKDLYDIQFIGKKKYIKYIARNWYVLLLYSQQMETELRSWNDNADAIQIYCSIFHEEW